MSVSGITCAQVDADDLDNRYLAGQLAGAEAEAFEAHFFACERCWRLVHRGVEIRAAESVRSAEPGSGGATRTVWQRRGVRWWPLAAAAGLATIVVTWQLVSDATVPPADNLRGPATPPAALEPVMSTRDGDLVTVWAPIPDAALYVVRVITADGMLVAEREVADTILVLAADTLRAALARRAAFLQVEALDALRAGLARSLPRPLPLPDAR